MPFLISDYLMQQVLRKLADPLATQFTKALYRIKLGPLDFFINPESNFLKDKAIRILEDRAIEYPFNKSLIVYGEF